MDGLDDADAALSALAGLVFLVPWEVLTFRHESATFYQRWPSVFRGMVVGVLLILLAMGLTNDASTFIYFQF